MPNVNKATIETRIEIVGGVSVVKYNIYVFDDRFPESSVLHKRLKAVFYNRRDAEEYTNLLNKGIKHD